MATTRTSVKATSQTVTVNGVGYSCSATFHPDYVLRPSPLYWNTGNGYRTDRCLNAEGYSSFYRSSGNYAAGLPDFYVGGGDPQASASAASATASELVGSGIGVVFGPYGSNVPGVGSLVEGASFTEYERAMRVNRAGWGLCSYSGAAYAEAHEWKYAPGAGRCPYGVTPVVTVGAKAVAASGSVLYGIFVDGARVSSGTSASVGDRRDVTEIVAVFGLPFTVRFEANGGAGEMAAAARVFGVGEYVPQDALPACAFTRAGKVFAGWNTAADGSGAAVADGAAVDEAFEGVVTANGQAVVLYAQWRDPNVVATKANAEAGGADASGVGTLRLLSSADGYASPVASEDADGVLRFEGTAGAKYRLSCLMGGSGSPDFLWDALGVRSASGSYDAEPEIDFTGGASATSLVYEFAAKPRYTFEVVSAHGAVAVSPAPDDADGRYARGRTLALAIAPDPGYGARRVTFVDVDTNDVYHAEVKGGAASLDGISFNARAVVDYAQVDYALSASVDPASAAAVASASVSVGGEAAETAYWGDEAVFSATVAEGYSFAGWYGADGALVSEEAEYAATVSGALALAAKAKVAVSLGVEYSGEGARSCSLSVDGAPYEPGTPFSVVLGGSFSYALALGERADGAAWAFDCWAGADGAALPHPKDGTLAPSAALSMSARVAASVVRALDVYVARVGDEAASLVDADDVPGAVSCRGAAAEAEATAGGDGAADPFSFVFRQTQRVTVSALDEVTPPGGGGALSFYCLSSDAPGSFEGGVPPDAGVVSWEAEAALLLNAERLALYAYYGAPKAVVTALAYAALSDATMGSLAVVAADPEDAAASIAPDGMSATATQGRTLTVRATPANGWRFAGWFLSPTAAGDPALAAATAEVRVTSRRTLYAKFAKDAHAICEWEGSTESKALVWRSKTYEASRPFNPSACRVDALGYAGDAKGTLLELTIDMFSAPDSAATATVKLVNIASQNARRLPVRRPERFMQVAVKANVEVDALLVGTSMGGLAQ